MLCTDVAIQTLASWNWANIDVFDLHLDARDKKVGLKDLAMYPYPFLTPSLLMENAHEVRSLKTSSIDTISVFGDALRNLKTLEYTIKLGDVTGVSHQWVADHTDQIKDLRPTMIKPLKSWARNMIEFDERATEILGKVLRNNQRLRSVTLQLQENHWYGVIMGRLAGLRHLKTLVIGGSNLHNVDVRLLQSMTETVLDILKRCESLNVLVFNPMPIQRSGLRFHTAYYASPITALDLSGIRRRRMGDHDQGSEYPFHIHYVVPHCPNLRVLSMPQRVRAVEFEALTPVMMTSCPRLRSLYLNSTNLHIPPFTWFMESMAGLKALSVNNCLFRADDFEAWLASPKVQQSLESVTVCYDDLEGYRESKVLMLMMPDGGTVDKTKNSWIRKQTSDLVTE
ncbi:hypothetical protein B0O80DRAFT_425145 [Mortierella sp. GBAus27b]|nr:hypothetical protein BGX31_010708 [Mortierella sp. GBA43]KAI8356259.1 hypothetical protein B0O80DRAFT_425145 [Mortierella sp. GBAus27b]